MDSIYGAKQKDTPPYSTPHNSGQTARFSIKKTTKTGATNPKKRGACNCPVSGHASSFCTGGSQKLTDFIALRYRKRRSALDILRVDICPFCKSSLHSRNSPFVYFRQKVFSRDRFQKVIPGFRKSDSGIWKAFSPPSHQSKNKNNIKTKIQQKISCMNIFTFFAICCNIR